MKHRDAVATSARSHRARRWAILGFLAPALAVAAWIATRPADPVPRSEHAGAVTGAELGPPAAGPATPSTTTEPDAAAGSVDLVVRDLWDGAPIAALTLRASVGGETLELTSDERGKIRVQAKELVRIASLASSAPEYKVASKIKEVQKSLEVWCHALRAVSGRVVFEGVAGRAFDEVTLSYSPRYLAGETGSPKTPGFYAWMNRNRVIPAKLGPVKEDGTFRLELPRIGGAAVVARARGWFPAWAALDNVFAGADRELVLVLRRGIHLAGTLRDEHGTPLAGQKVHVYVLIKTRLDDLDEEAVGRLKQSGFTVARSRKDDWARLKLPYHARTDAKGVWGVDIDSDGEVLIVAYPVNRAAIELHAGTASRIDDQIDLKARPSAHERIRILKGGRALAETVLLWVDLSLLDAKPSFRLTSDGDGFVQSTWFVPGKRYAIFALPDPAAFFRYSGQRTIDLDACERDFDRFMAH